ncbi:unnamed protein product [Medioppia subpectinata]|uniref:Peptidase S9 prolyl oligopeptidase catalytic domain-containing protein n=1 Tax=Medioppia subpectinata TaxID=1979941 RepID=A0A7R9LK67_9ACAR|nr:unnamed protein product [Medioppia subpectinata]CAG2118973.1 unnamed protein product [Medioppia subpectinata]
MYYDSVYVERYMGFPTPEDNLKNYILSSTLNNVKHLNGKQFLVMFGTADDNVHTMNSMMLLKSMNEANIKYQTQIYPDNRHSLHQSMAHMYIRMIDFFDHCFNHSVYVERYMGFPTPEDNLKNYILSSTLNNVKHLNGKQFLVMFGTADDNVHTMNSMMLLKAMNEANIKYQTQIYPDNRHSLHQSMAHMYIRMIDFFDHCFNRNIKHK